MSETTTAGSQAESIEMNEWQTLEEFVEKRVIYGSPVCTTCFDRRHEDRHEDSELWPDSMTLFVDRTAESSPDGARLPAKRCQHHATEEAPERATHRVEVTVVEATDHTHPDSYRYEIQSVKGL